MATLDRNRNAICQLTTETFYMDFHGFIQSKMRILAMSMCVSIVAFLISIPCPWQTEEGHGYAGEPGGRRVPQGLQQADGWDNEAYDSRERLNQRTVGEDVGQDDGTDPGEWRVEAEGETTEAAHRDAGGEREGARQEEHQQSEGMYVDEWYVVSGRVACI